jgi:DNA-binding response OmpR family regulator
VEHENLLEGVDIDLPWTPHTPLDSPTALPLFEGPGNDLERQFLGPYELISRIGSGGVAVVYRARHMHPGYSERPMAIKVLLEHLNQNAQIIELFRREARVLSLIKHPNVIDTFEAGVQDGRMFLVMEYIDGRDLENLLWRAKKLKLQVPQSVYLHVVGEVLRGLAYAHALRDFDDVALGVVHRDVNPANVFIAYDGRVKLGDFGVTSVLVESSKKHREVAGKVGYFAPEQLAGETIDGRADVFAVGVMLFEILTGQRLFDGADTEASMRQNALAQVPDMLALNADLSPGLIGVTLKALAKKVGDRYTSATDMLNALAPYLSDRRAVTLALRSLMRTAFVLDHGREMDLRDRLAHRAPIKTLRPVVDIVMPDVLAQQALAQLLDREGYVARCHTTVQALYAQQSTATAQVILWGLTDDDAPTGHSPGTALPQAHVVAMGRVLDAATIAWGVNLGAEDLLFRPLPPQRVLNAVREGVQRTYARRTPEAAVVPRRLRMLVVSQNPDLIEQWHRELGTQGYQITTASDAEAALLGTCLRSFELVALDMSLMESGFSTFIAHYRAAPGMGMVPMLLLAQKVSQLALEAWPERTLVALQPPSLMPLVDQVLRVGPGGNSRSYVRYDASMPLQIRFGGRVFAAEAVNISRGGLLVHTAHLPSINTDLGLVMDLGHGVHAEAQGTALRVLLGRDRDQQAEGARIGIALRRFFSDGEARYIERITALAQAYAVPKNLTDKARSWWTGKHRS